MKDQKWSFYCNSISKEMIMSYSIKLNANSFFSSFSIERNFVCQKYRIPSNQWVKGTPQFIDVEVSIPPVREWKIELEDKDGFEEIEILTFFFELKTQEEKSAWDHTLTYLQEIFYECLYEPIKKKIPHRIYEPQQRFIDLLNLSIVPDYEDPNYVIVEDQRERRFKIKFNGLIEELGGGTLQHVMVSRETLNHIDYYAQWETGVIVNIRQLFRKYEYVNLENPRECISYLPNEEQREVMKKFNMIQYEGTEYHIKCRIGGKTSRYEIRPDGEIIVWNKHHQDGLMEVLLNKEDLPRLEGSGYLGSWEDGILMPSRYRHSKYVGEDKYIKTYYKVGDTCPIGGWKKV